MNIDKYKNKIRKLLALAQSDNEHEAAQAMKQAKLLMTKFGIAEDECEIIEVTAKQIIKRKSVKKYESLLVSSVATISGTEAFLRGGYNGSRWHSVVAFLGTEQHAGLAAYCFDLLIVQCEAERNRFKAQHRGLLAAQLDRYCEAWAFSAARKIINVFGEAPEHEATKNASDAMVKRNSMKALKPKSAKSTGDEGLDQALDGLGYRAGSKAQVNVPVGMSSSDRLGAA